MAKYNATFTSVWDGGFEVSARCFASKRKHMVTRMGKNDACECIGDYVEVLEDEYITFDTGERYKAVPEDEMEEWEEMGVEVYGY